MKTAVVVAAVLLVGAAVLFNPSLLTLPAIGAVIVGGIMLHTPHGGDIGEEIETIESEPVETPAEVPAEPTPAKEPVPA